MLACMKFFFSSNFSYIREFNFINHPRMSFKFPMKSPPHRFSYLQIEPDKLDEALLVLLEWNGL